jgi:hypothetical protein
MGRTLLLALLAVVCAAATSAAPTIVFDDESVSVSEITASGRVAFFSMAFERAGFRDRLTRRDDLLTDEDGDGTVRVDLERPVPPASLWVAVDLATGELALALPEGSPFREVAFPARGLGAELRWLEDRRNLLDLFLVRAGNGADAGAWGISLADGGSGDDDRSQNRSIRAATLDFRPVGDSPQPPERLAPGDLLVGFDPDTLELYAVRLPGGGN